MPLLSRQNCKDRTRENLRPVIMKLEATDEESKIACERQ
jgi:hypothetical protein